MAPRGVTSYAEALMFVGALLRCPRRPVRWYVRSAGTLLISPTKRSALDPHRPDAPLVERVAEAWTRRTLWFGMFMGLLMLVIGVASIIISASQ
jgi:hypothetical protein